MGNCQTALGKSCSSSNEDGARLDLKSSEESIVGDNEVNMSPIEAEIDVSSSGSVAVSTNNIDQPIPQTFDLDDLPPLGDSTSNTEAAEEEQENNVSSSTLSSSSGGVQEERRVVVDNNTVSVASNDSSANSVVIVEDVSHQSEDDEIRNLHASYRNLHPSEGQIMEPLSESSLDESSGESTPSSTTKINNSNVIGESGGVDIRPTTAEKSRDVTLHTSPLDTKEEAESSKPHPQCSPRKSLHVLKQDSNQNGDLDAVVKSDRKDDKKDESTKPFPQQHQHSEEVQNFLLFTGTTDHNIANQYLEMSGPHNVDMAVSLYIDYQLQSLPARQKTVQPPPPPPKVEKKSWVQVGNKWVPVDKSCVSKLPVDNKGTVPQELTLKPQKAVSPLPAPFQYRRRVGVSPPMVVSPDTNYIPNDVTSVQLSVCFTSLQPDTFRDCKKLITVQLNKGLKKIWRDTFRNCVSLRSLTLPSTLVEIDNHAFCECLSLREVIFNEGLRKVGRSVYKSCLSLTHINLPSTLTDLGLGAFIHNINLKEVIINEGLKIIQQQTFSKCSALESISFPSTLTEIGTNAFSECIQLKELVLNEGLQKIRSDAFKECSSLQRIYVPSTITEICVHAFQHCNRMKEVVINERIQDLGANSLIVGKLPLKELRLPLLDCRNLQRFKFASLSARLENVIQRGYWSEIEDKVDAIDGVIERSGDGELFISRAVIRQGNDNTWASVQRCINQIARLIGYYEMKEVTSMVELALWKCKISQASAISSSDRDACRVDMPGPAKDMILQYLWG